MCTAGIRAACSINLTSHESPVSIGETGGAGRGVVPTGFAVETGLLARRVPGGRSRTLYLGR
jgi:hypothetical protein